MKKILFTILMLVGIAYGQSTVYLRADTIKMQRTGGNSNLQILNATRDSTNGVLINTGNGITSFQRIRAINDSQFTVGTDTITLAGATGASTDSAAILINANGGGYELINFQTADTVKAKNLLSDAGTFIALDSTASAITFSNDTAGLRSWILTFATSASGDTANLIFDTIPVGGSPTALFQSGDTLRTRAFGDSTLISWVINGDGKLVAVLDTANAFFDGGGGGGCATCWTYNAATTTGADGILGTQDNYDVHLYTNNTKRAEFTNDGKFLWNATASTAGHNVYFNDTTEVKALRILASGTAMSGGGSNAQLGIKAATNSSSEYNTLITDHTNTMLFRVSNSGVIAGAFGTLQNNAWQLASTTGSIRASSAATTTGAFLSLTHLNASTHTSGDAIVVRTTGNMIASSGTGTLTSLEVRPTWNQTGTASGRLWGLKINPSYTAVLGEPRWTEYSSTATNWPSYYESQARVTTTNADTTILFTFTTEGLSDPNNSMSYVVKAKITANRTGGSGGTNGDIGVYEYHGVYKRINNVITNVYENITSVFENQSAWDITSNISGTTIRLRVIGAADNNISWHMTQSEVHRAGE